MQSPLFTRRRVGAVAALAVAVAAGLPAGSAQAADPRLDMADAALQKAKALLEASSSGGGIPAKAQREFDRHVQRAIDQVNRARAEIEAAKYVVDSNL